MILRHVIAQPRRAGYNPPANDRRALAARKKDGGSRPALRIGVSYQYDLALYAERELAEIRNILAAIKEENGR